METATKTYVRYSGTVSVGCDQLAPKPGAIEDNSDGDAGTPEYGPTSGNQGQPHCGVPACRHHRPRWKQHFGELVTPDGDRLIHKSRTYLLKLEVHKLTKITKESEGSGQIKSKLTRRLLRSQHSDPSSCDSCHSWFSCYGLAV